MPRRSGGTSFHGGKGRTRKHRKRVGQQKQQRRDVRGLNDKGSK